MLGNGWNNFLHFLCETYLSEIVKFTFLDSEGLADNQGTVTVRLEHFLVFFTSEEPNVDGVVDDGLPITLEGAPNDLHVRVKEIVLKVSARSQVDQVQDVPVLVVEIVRRIGIRLHHLELKKFLEAKFDK